MIWQRTEGRTGFKNTETQVGDIRAISVVEKLLGTRMKKSKATDHVCPVEHITYYRRENGSNRLKMGILYLLLLLFVAMPHFVNSSWNIPVTCSTLCLQTAIMGSQNKSKSQSWVICGSLLGHGQGLIMEKESNRSHFILK